MPGNRAAVYAKPGQNSIEIRDHEIPEPDHGQVLVKFSHSGVCHSDLHLMQLDWPWMNAAITPGRVGGHEGIGKVVKLGSGVTNLKEGQSVGVKWVARACLCCEQCMAGRDGLCVAQDVSGGTVDGTFQQYAVQDAKYITPVAEGVDPAQASVMLCAGVTIYKAIKVTGIKQGDWLAIAGAGGGLGHIGVQIAKAQGFRVIAIDSGDKAELCRSLGAEVFVDFRKQDVTKSVLEASEGVGAHAVVVANAAPASYKIATSLVRTGGVICCVGIPGGPTPIDVDANEVILKDLHIRGSAVGTRQDTLEALAFLERGQVKPIIKVQKLDTLQDIFEQLKKGDVGGRIVVEIGA